jgi:tetratricopeptide (TPR) repeat protein
MTAIELYREAYDHDYRKGDWEYAEQLYRQIIEEFPYSEEKEYARVHLERLAKLKADPHNRSLQPIRSTAGPGALAIFTFLFLLVLTAGSTGLGYWVWRQHLALNYQNLVLQGLFSERAGDIDAAANRYKQAQEVLPASSLAYRQLADLYLNAGQLELAAIEHKRWALTDPDDPALSHFTQRMKRRQTTP